MAEKSTLMQEFRVSSLRMGPAHMLDPSDCWNVMPACSLMYGKRHRTGGTPRRPGADTILGNSGVNSHAGAEYEPVRRQYVVHRSSLGTRNTRGYRLRNWGTRVSPEADFV
jgi:hypothetical protein